LHVYDELAEWWETLPKKLERDEIKLGHIRRWQSN
jgi:hypothetical protein